jgi:hypothetical protein
MGVEKMKRFVLGLGCVAGLMLPSIASAALSLQIGPQSSPATPDATYTTPGLPSGQQFFDLIFTETDPTVNEGLFAYDLAASVVRPAGMGSGQGLRLGGAERPADNYVLDVPSGSTFTVAENTPDRLLVNVSSNNDLADITTGKKAARVFYTLDPAAVPGNYTIVFDTASTVFGSGDPNQPLEIPVTLTDAGFVRIDIVPEPASLSLLGIAGLLALRRRRTA